MMRLKGNFWYWGALALATVVAGAGQAVAASGFVVSPAFQQVQIRTDEPQAVYELNISNNNSKDQSFLLSVVDFGSLDESGGVAFLGAPATELEHKYGLASWMTLEKNTVFVPAGKTAAVKVTIDNRASLAPGGHYGAVLATAVGDPGTPQGDSVGVKQVVSSLVLVAKDGGAAADLRLDSVTADHSLWRLPVSVTQRFQNDGNVHVVPRGVVELRDPTGKVVRRAAINDGSQIILPESFRRYKTDLTNVAAALWPGKYTLVSHYRYDGLETTATSEMSFWYAGQLIVWVVAVLALLAAAVLAWWLLRNRRRKKR